MSSQVYSVPYGTVRLHDPTDPSIRGNGLVGASHASPVNPKSNCNSNSRGSLSLAGSPTPSSQFDDQDEDEEEEADQDNSADYSIESSNSKGSKKSATSKPKGGAKRTAAPKKSGVAKKAGGASKRKAKSATPAPGGLSEHDEVTGRRKIQIRFVEDDNRRHVTFSKRKAGIMKKAYELATLTGTQVLLLIVSQSDQVFTFATPKLQPIVMESEGQELIQSCLQAPDHDVKAEPEDSDAAYDGAEVDIEVEAEEEEDEEGEENREDPNFEREEGFNPEADEEQDELNGVSKAQHQTKSAREAFQKTKKTARGPRQTKGNAGGVGQGKKTKAQAQIDSQIAPSALSPHEEVDETEENPPPALIQRNQPTLDEEEQRRPHKRSRDEMTSDSVILDSDRGNLSPDHGLDLNINGNSGLGPYWNGNHDDLNDRTTSSSVSYHSSNNYSHISSDHQQDRQHHHGNYPSSPHLSSHSSPTMSHNQPWNREDDHLRNDLRNNSSLSTMLTSDSSHAGSQINPYRSSTSNLASGSLSYGRWGA